MHLASDQELQALASERAEELFPLLRRRVYDPLLVLLAFLPVVYSVVWATLDDRGARWGLRSLEVYTAEDAAAFLDPAADDRNNPLRWQPPMQNWLTAGVMWLLGPSHGLALWVVPYLATSALIGMFLLLGERLGGTRFALWCAAILACHGPLLGQAQDPAPESLPQALALVTFWAFLRHLERSRRIVSLRLVLGGAALGGTALAGGPLAVVVCAILLIWSLTLRGTRIRSRRGAATEQEWKGRLALKSLLVLCGVGAIVGGWWFGWMLLRHGPDFLAVWWTGRNVALPTTAVANEGGSVLRFLGQGGVQMLGPLAGLAVLGVWLAVRNLWRDPDETRRDGARFLVIWVAWALGGWIFQLLVSQAGTSAEPLWRGFLLLPGVALAAWSVEAIALRRVPVALVVGVAGATTLALLWPPLVRIAVDLSRSEAIWLGGLAAAAVATAWWWLLRFCGGGDPQQRLILVGLILGLLLGNALAGLASVRKADQDDQALVRLREDLVTAGEAATWRLVAADEPPLPLWWTLRSVWPDAEPHPPAETWDAVFSQMLSAQPPLRRMVVVDWSERDVRPATIQLPGVRVTPIGRPRFLGRRHLRAFVVTTGE